MSVWPLTLASTRPLLTRLPVGPMNCALPIVPRPWTMALAPSVSVPPPSRLMAPVATVPLPMLRVALSKVWLPPPKPMREPLLAAVVATLITPGLAPASVSTVRPLVMRTAPGPPPRSTTLSVPRTVTPLSRLLVLVNCSPLAPANCKVPPLIVPPFMRIEPVAAEKLSVPARFIVPVRLSAPPALLSKVPSAVLLKVPPRLIVLAASATWKRPLLLQAAVGCSVRMPPPLARRTLLLVSAVPL